MNQARGDQAAVRWRAVNQALADPLRIQLLETLWETPRSARELAGCVGLPADRLYYHLGQLESAGLVEVAEYRRLARGKVERVYAPAIVDPPGDAATPEDMTTFLGSMLDATRADISSAYRAKATGRRREVDLLRGSLRLTDEALTELRGHVKQLASRFQDPKTQSEGVWASVIFAVVDLQDRPAPAGDGPRSLAPRPQA